MDKAITMLSWKHSFVYIIVNTCVQGRKINITVESRCVENSDDSK